MRKLREYLVDVLWVHVVSQAASWATYKVDAASKLDAAFRLGARHGNLTASGYECRVLAVSLSQHVLSRTDNRAHEHTTPEEVVPWPALA